MAIVYRAITAFERSARRFVTKVLMSEFGENWWEEKVSDKIKKFVAERQGDEERTKWHGGRGDDPITCTEMSHIPNIVQQNWEVFEPHVRRLDWVTAIFGTVERSRNVIMHSGVLGTEDVERVGMSIRDWIKQVGA